MMNTIRYKVSLLLTKMAWVLLDAADALDPWALEDTLG